jgi:hypothetical protein
MKNYDPGINYYPRGVNVVVNAWSWWSHLSWLVVEKMPSKLCEKLDKLNLRIVTKTEVVEMKPDSTLL